VIYIIIILAIIYTVVDKTYNKYENYLTGLWVGNAAFLKKAQLQDFQLFIAPSENGNRQGYLIITDLDNEFILNKAITIHSSQCWKSIISSIFQTKDDIYKKYSLNIEFDSDESKSDGAKSDGAKSDGAKSDESNSDNPKDPIPNNIKLTLSMLNGTLTLYDDKKVYAFMEKDLVASAAAIEAYNE